MRAKISLLLVSIALTLFALEAGLRFYLSHYGDERQKTLYLYTREEINQKQTLLRGLAFLNYGLSPTHEGVNSRGYRGPEIAVPKPAEVYRIVALGGSTTFGLFLENWRLAYPHRLQRHLRRAHGYSHVEVVNAGAPQYTTWESAVNMLLRVPELEPDMVIIYHGINDVGVRLTDPEYFDGLYSAKGYWTDQEDPLPPFSLLRFGMQRLGFELQADYRLDAKFRVPAGIRSCMPGGSALDGYCSGFDMAARDVLRANPPKYFERNMRSMIRLAHDMNSETLLLTWAYSPLDFPIEGGGGMVYQYLQDGVEEHNAIVRRLATEESALFFDLAASMPIEERFWGKRRTYAARRRRRNGAPSGGLPGFNRRAGLACLVRLARQTRVARGIQGFADDSAQFSFWIVLRQ